MLSLLSPRLLFTHIGVGQVSHSLWDNKTSSLRIRQRHILHSVFLRKMKTTFFIFLYFFVYDICMAGNLSISQQSAGFANNLAETIQPTSLFIQKDGGVEEVFIQSTKPYAALASCTNGNITKEILIPASFKGSLGEAISLFESPVAFYNEFKFKVMPTAETVGTGLTDNILNKESNCIIILGSTKDMAASSVALVLSVVDLGFHISSVIAAQTPVTKKNAGFLKALSAYIKNGLMLEALKDVAFQDAIYTDVVNSANNKDMLQKILNRSYDFFIKQKNKLIDSYLKKVFSEMFDGVSSDLIGVAFEKSLLAAKSLASIEKIGNIAGIASHLLARKSKGKSVVAVFIIDIIYKKLKYINNNYQWQDIQPECKFLTVIIA